MDEGERKRWSQDSTNSAIGEICVYLFMLPLCSPLNIKLLSANTQHTSNGNTFAIARDRIIPEIYEPRRTIPIDHLVGKQALLES